MMNKKDHTTLSWIDFSTSVHTDDHKCYYRTQYVVADLT